MKSAAKKNVDDDVDGWTNKECRVRNGKRNESQVCSFVCYQPHWKRIQMHEKLKVPLIARLQKVNPVNE